MKPPAGAEGEVDFMHGFPFGQFNHCSQPLQLKNYPGPLEYL